MPIHLSDPLLNLAPIIWLTHNTWPLPLSTPLLRRWTVSVPKHWLQDSWYPLPGSETNSPHNSASVLHPRNNYIFHYFIICRNCTSQSQNLIINFCHKLLCSGFPPSDCFYSFFQWSVTVFTQCLLCLQTNHVTSSGNNPVKIHMTLSFMGTF